MNYETHSQPPLSDEKYFLNVTFKKKKHTNRNKQTVFKMRFNLRNVDKINVSVILNSKRKEIKKKLLYDLEESRPITQHICMKLSPVSGFMEAYDLFRSEKEKKNSGLLDLHQH